MQRRGTSITRTPPRRPVAIDGARHEGFDLRDIRAGHALELGDLDKPHAGDLHRRVLAAQIGEIVSNPRRTEHLDRRRFQKALRAFEYDRAVGFNAGPVNARNARDQPSRTDRANIGTIFGTKVITVATDRASVVDPTSARRHNPSRGRTDFPGRSLRPPGPPHLAKRGCDSLEATSRSGGHRDPQ